MPVSGLVITLKPDERQAREVEAALAADPRVTLAPRQGSRLPVAVDTVDRDEDKTLWNWLNALPGVVFVDVVFVHFDDEPSDVTSRAHRGEATRAVCLD